MRESKLNDQEIRYALKNLLRKRGAPLVIDEFELLNGQSRVDLFFYDNVFSGIEIKSDLDSLSRLPKQIEIYNRYLEKIEIVVGSSHLQKVLEIVPRWWGITIARSATNNISFKVHRRAHLNPSFHTGALIDFLWKDEVIELLSLYGFSKGLKSRCRYDLRSSAKNYVSHDELRYFVFDFMKKRENWRSDELQK